MRTYVFANEVIFVEADDIDEAYEKLGEYIREPGAIDFRLVDVTDEEEDPYELEEEDA